MAPSLVELRDHYRSYLFGEYLPFWDQHGVDHELGGFLCSLDHDGSLVGRATKDMWYQGRGLWTYSYLYRNFGGEAHLDVARKTRDFLIAHGRDAQGMWVGKLSIDGLVLTPASNRGYESLFVAEGMQAYAHATGDHEAFDIAVESLENVLRLFDDRDRICHEGYIPHAYPGMRLLGGHMVILLILTQMLEQQPENDRLLSVADNVIDDIVHRFWNDRHGLMNEVLANDLTRPSDANEDFCYLGHSIETLWITMAEALRRQDQNLFDLCAARFRRHVEVAWDDVHGGLFRALRVNSWTYTLDKKLWLQEEAMIGCMMMIEHDPNDAWARLWFERIFDYVENRFRLRRHGHPLYQYSGDRRVRYTPHVDRQENYHHPRCVMRNLLALERMIARKSNAISRP